MRYEYSDLKRRLKVGQVVRVVKENGEWYDTNAKTFGEVEHVGELSFVVNGYRHDYTPGHWLEIADETIATRSSRDWDRLKEGDMVELNGKRQLVLGLTGKVIFIAFEDNDNRCQGGYTMKQLQGYDYTIVQPEQEVMELTVADVEAKFGRKVKIVKGK